MRKKSVNQLKKYEETGKYSETTALQKLFSELAPRYAERNGGYTRILKTEPRRGCCANGYHRIGIISSILLSVMMMEYTVILSLVLFTAGDFPSGNTHHIE